MTSTPKPTCTFKNCSLVCAYHCAQLSYTIQHRTVLVIFPDILHSPDHNQSSNAEYWRGGWGYFPQRATAKFHLAK